MRFLRFIMSKFAEIRSIVFLASTVFLLHHFTTILLPFDYVALHINTAIAFDESNKIDFDFSKHSIDRTTSKFSLKLLNNTYSDSPIILLYDQEKFNRRFRGITPLDRCILADDLKDILKRGPKVVGIDIDLSPLEYADENYEKCQKKLDKTLRENSKRLVLIEPIDKNEKALKWKDKLERDGVVFANPSIIATLGIVLNQNPYYNSLAHLMVLKQKCKNIDISDEKNADNVHIEPINYYAAGKFMSKEDKNVSLENKVVFLGGSYGVGDVYLTPIGNNVPGVIVHAYDYFSNIHPIKTEGIVNLIAFLLDIIFAFIASFIMKKMWDIYIDLLKKKVSYSYMIIILNLFILILLTIIGVYIASILLKWNIWFSPIPIIIGIFADGLISVLIEQLEKCEEGSVVVTNQSMSSIILDKAGYFLKEMIVNSVILLTLILILYQIFFEH